MPLQLDLLEECSQSVSSQFGRPDRVEASTFKQMPVLTCSREAACLLAAARTYTGEPIIPSTHKSKVAFLKNALRP